MRKLALIYNLTFIIYNSFCFAQQDSMVVNEYSIGLDYQTIGISKYAAASRTYPSAATTQVSTQSLSARMQSSIFEKLWKKRRKFNVTDFLASEFNVGNKYLTHQPLNAYLAYRFEYGASLLWRASANHQFGLHVIVLKFTHTGIMANVSGSAIVLRYKYKRILFEPALESQTQLFFGWFAAVAQLKNYTIPLQASGSIKYQHKGNMYGVRASYFPVTNIPFQADYVRTLNNFSIRVFIGLCF
ncbi:MAG: hypothetical protein ACYDCN_06660 [Bacteroidia bacterium]